MKNISGAASKIFLAAFLVAVTSASQTYPGTSSRPILSETEAATLSEPAYLQGWSVEAIQIPITPDYTVGAGENYTDIQAAVNAAIEAGGSVRKYIKINAGTYAQTVFTSGEVPITLYGGGSKPDDVIIALNQAAQLSVANWTEQVNPGGTRYQSGDPAYSVYNQCAKRNGTIGTTCTSIVWVKSSNFQLYNLQVHNLNSQTGDAQAVAVKVDADKVRLSRVYLISGQDTFYTGSGKTGLTQRVYVDKSYIEGDVDFVFGGATTIFKHVTFNARSDRHPGGAIVFAPNTAPNNQFGFLVENCTITGDPTFQSTQKVKLARAWDSNTPAGQYVVGTSPNGQVLIRNTKIDAVILVTAPYSPATSSRSYAGDASTNRTLDNNNFNRFWEYQNTGSGA